MQLKIPNSHIKHPLLEAKQVELWILRLDEIHADWGGNKYFKLKYNLEMARNDKHSTLLSFGGAYSNHIAALAAIGKAHNFQTIGVIRGEKSENMSHTLKFAERCGMKLIYVSREDYRKKESDEFINHLKKNFGNFYLIPEGGSNNLGVKGCAEILPYVEFDFDVACCACGTGATLAGLVVSLKKHQSALGFSSLKGGDFLAENVNSFIKNYRAEYSTDLKQKWQLISDYHYGGYGKINEELLKFNQDFYTQNGIELDLVYTTKMMKGIMHLVKGDYFKTGTKIMAIHTGGLQGNKGFYKS